MTFEWKLPICDGEHGEDSPHELVHEAGHALAAWCWGIPIDRVEFFAPGAGRAIKGSSGSDVASAQVLTSPDPRFWSRRHPHAAAHFHFAGMAGEIAVFGHALPAGSDEDRALLRDRLQLPSRDVDELERDLKLMLGTTYEGDYVDTLAPWAAAHLDSLGLLCDLLSSAKNGGAVSGETITLALGSDHCGRQDTIGNALAHL